MSTEIKNTLFRFVTMRAPQLSNNEDKEKRFVLRNPTVTGVFDVAVANKIASETKWNAMKAACETFEAFSSDEDVKIINQNLYDFSIWLVKNRFNYSKVELLNKVNQTTFDINTIPFNALWNNLFYQVITQKDFYIKESIIHLLVAINFLENFDADKVELNETLMNATVVLPSLLFEEENTILNSTNKLVTKSLPKVSFPTKSMKMFQNVDNASTKNENYKKLQKELVIIEKNYKKEYQKELSINQKVYNTKIKIILDNYRQEVALAKKTWCTIRDPKIVYDSQNPCDQVPYVAYPELPEFVFDFREEIDFKDLSTKLSAENFETLNELLKLNYIDSKGKIEVPADSSNDEFTTYEGIYNEINTNISSSNQIIADNTTQQENSSVSIGGVIMPISPNNSQPFSYQLCPKRFSNTEMIGFYLVVSVPDFTWIIRESESSYKLIDFAPNGVTVHSTEGTSITIFLNGNYDIDAQNNATGIEVTLAFENGSIKTFSITSSLEESIFKSCFDGNLEDGLNANGESNNPIKSEAPFIPSGFGVKQLGIADYKKVEQSVQCYVEGEVANIENVMARERREKSTRRLIKKEETDTFSTDTETEKITDTSSTNRFEMQSEVAKVIQESKDFSANAHFDVRLNKATFGGSASFATHSSKEQNTRQAITQAKEITEKASDRITTKVHQERITKITEEFEENNIHEFDNRKGDKHVVGVYRWVDKVYKNQIVNYGKRLMFEFMIPEPARLHIYGMKELVQNNPALLIVAPIDPRTATVHQIADFESLTDIKLKYWSGIYNAEIKAQLQDEISVGESFQIGIEGGSKLGRIEAKSGNGKIKIPQGYYTYYAKGFFNAISDNDYGGHLVSLTIGNKTVKDTTALDTFNLVLDGSIQSYIDEVPVSFTLGNHVSGDISASVNCRVTDAAKKQWRLETFNAIITKYEEALANYNKKLEDEDEKAIVIKETNPGFYRQIENTVLRKNCISYMIDQTTTAKNTYGKDLSNGLISFGQYEIKVDKNLDDYAALVKFMEQAFEWDIMSYNFYPYYWGNRNNWTQMYQQENNDPLFRSFMQSGMARTIVTVKPGFEKAVRFYMQTGLIWNGGEVPVIEDKLFMSIVDELREPEGKPEGKAWATRVPTSLTILQANSIGLQVEKALPCHCEDVNEDTFENPQDVPCSDSFVLNNAQINGATGTAKVFGKIEGNQDLNVIITLKTLEGLFQDSTNCDENGDWEIKNIPVGTFILNLDATNLLPIEDYEILEGVKEQTIILETLEVMEINLKINKL